MRILSFLKMLKRSEFQEIRNKVCAGAELIFSSVSRKRFKEVTLPLELYKKVWNDSRDHFFDCL